MQDKDKQIEKLFDNYADSLPEQPHLAEKARGIALSRSRKKTRWWVSFVAVCGVLIAVLVLSLGVLGKLIPQVRPQQNYSLYTNSDVTGKRADLTLAKDYINIQGFDGNENYTVVSENYYAYYFKDSDELAYIKAFIGISTENGIVEVTLIAEKDQFVRMDLVSEYRRYIAGNNSPVTFENLEANRGEYVTAAYFKAKGMHFYVATQSNPSTAYDVEKILEIFY